MPIMYYCAIRNYSIHLIHGGNIQLKMKNKTIDSNNNLSNLANYIYKAMTR